MSTKNENLPVYVVSGYMRSGTSMMMKALEAGGLEAVKREEREKMRIKRTDAFYNPNQGGLYELVRKDVMSPDFPNQFRGKAIKCLAPALGAMDVVDTGIKMVFMRRDPEEIQQSYLAFFGKKLPQTNEQIEELCDRAVRNMKNRRDVEFHEWQYRKVIEDPTYHFNSLLGWDIDKEAAAGVVDPKLLRYKREELTEGII